MEGPYGIDSEDEKARKLAEYNNKLLKSIERKTGGKPALSQVQSPHERKLRDLASSPDSERKRKNRISDDKERRSRPNPLKRSYENF